MNEPLLVLAGYSCSVHSFILKATFQLAHIWRETLNEIHKPYQLDHPNHGSHRSIRRPSRGVTATIVLP